VVVRPRGARGTAEEISSFGNQLLLLAAVGLPTGACPSRGAQIFVRARARPSGRCDSGEGASPDRRDRRRPPPRKRSGSSGHARHLGLRRQGTSRRPPPTRGSPGSCGSGHRSRCESPRLFLEGVVITHVRDRRRIGVSLAARGSRGSRRDGRDVSYLVPRTGLFRGSGGLADRRSPRTVTRAIKLCQGGRPL